MRPVRRIAAHTPRIVGSPSAFLLALVLVGLWAVGGFAVGWTDTWLLWPSAIASVVTFLIAFSLQYTQNRDTRAIQLKLDEILRANESARSELIKLEARDDKHLEDAESEIVRLRDEVES